jgi:hypothetical protein
MLLIGDELRTGIENSITGYHGSKLEDLVSRAGGTYAVKYVNSALAHKYEKPTPLAVSAHPLLTWGTGTYVTPLAFPLSSALYGRIGLVSDYDPTTWKIFDATDPKLRAIYIRWAQQQPIYNQLLLTVHSTIGNQTLRNRFKEDFKIDCVLFNPDQAADLHTDMREHVWMAVTEWENDRIATGPSKQFAKARFTVLIDEDFILEDLNKLPVILAERLIENITKRMKPNHGYPVSWARIDPALHAAIIDRYTKGGYLHIYIEP